MTSTTTPFAALRKLCDQLANEKRRMRHTPGTGQHNAYLDADDVAAHVEEARKALVPIAPEAPALPERWEDRYAAIDAKFSDEDKMACMLAEITEWRASHAAAPEGPTPEDIEQCVALIESVYVSSYTTKGTQYVLRQVLDLLRASPAAAAEAPDSEQRAVQITEADMKAANVAYWRERAEKAEALNPAATTASASVEPVTKADLWDAIHQYVSDYGDQFRVPPTTGATKRSDASRDELANIIDQLFRAPAQQTERMQPSQLPALDDDLRKILGRPNFTCGAIATLLRATGQDIKRRAEEEQAAVIYFLLNFYLQHGAKWSEAASAELNRLVLIVREGTPK